MSCKTVPQHVRRQSYAQAGFTAIRGENFPDANAAKRTTAAIDEQSVRGDLFAFADQLGASVFQVALDEGQSFLADGNNAFLVTLAYAANASCGTIQIHDAKMNEFGDSEAGGVENFQHGVVSKAERGLVIGLRQQALEFFQPEIARERTAYFGRFQIQ